MIEELYKSWKNKYKVASFSKHWLCARYIEYLETDSVKQSHEGSAFIVLSEP